MLSTCYSYVCITVAASLQMGLFADTIHTLPEDEKAHAAVISSVLFVMDVYATTALGLPRTLRDIEIHRVVPGLEMARDPHDPMFGTYKHARLIEILAKTAESNHPVTRRIPMLRNGFYGVEYNKIVCRENELTEWFDELNNSLAETPSTEEDPFIRSALLSSERYYLAQKLTKFKVSVAVTLILCSRADRPLPTFPSPCP